MGAPAPACPPRRYRLSPASSAPSPVAAKPSGSRAPTSRCAIGPSITVLISSGIAIWAPTAPIAAASISTSRHACGRRYCLVRHSAVSGVCPAGGGPAGGGPAGGGPAGGGPAGGGPAADCPASAGDSGWAGSVGIIRRLASRAAACHLNFAAWSRSATRPHGPGREVTVAGMAGTACVEWHLHAWDLARALGQDYRPADPDLLMAGSRAGLPQLAVSAAGDRGPRAALLVASRRAPGQPRPPGRRGRGAVRPAAADPGPTTPARGMC